MSRYKSRTRNLLDESTRGYFAVAAECDALKARVEELEGQVADLESEKAALITARNELQRTLFGPQEVKR